MEKQPGEVSLSLDFPYECITRNPELYVTIAAVFAKWLMHKGFQEEGDMIRSALESWSAKMQQDPELLQRTLG